jgi:hypothetical protein
VILSAATVEQMHSTLYTPDPRLQGTAYGLFDLSDNGWYTLGHDGDTLGFKAMILLMPDQHLGIFVAYNAEAADELTRQHFGFQRAFFDHYFPPAAVEPIQPPADFADRAARFEGSYLQTRSAHNTLEKYRNIAGGIVEISDNGDGTLNLGTPWGDWDYVEAAPLYFRQVDGPHAMLFREDDRGRISHVYIDLVPQFAFEKLNWYETAGFNFPWFWSASYSFCPSSPWRSSGSSAAAGTTRGISHHAALAQPSRFWWPSASLTSCSWPGSCCGAR